MEKEIKPCPYCGHAATIEQTGKDQLTLKCLNCGIWHVQRWLHQTREWLEDKMIETWNKRQYLSIAAAEPVKPNCWGLDTWCCCERCQSYSKYVMEKIISNDSFTEDITKLSNEEIEKRISDTKDRLIKMTKELKDYLHLYLGCEVETNHPNYLKALHKASDGEGCWLWTEKDGYERFLFGRIEVKPILRPLSDMTEDHCKILSWIFPVSDYVAKHFLINGMLPEEMRKCLEWGYDLFGLIESGLAISKKLNSEPDAQPCKHIRMSGNYCMDCGWDKTGNYH